MDLKRHNKLARWIELNIYGRCYIGKDLKGYGFPYEYGSLIPESGTKNAFLLWECAMGRMFFNRKKALNLK